jgi:nucleotide-binding universal stress UspA family protein
MTDLKILVPLDGSQFAEWALPTAVSLAGKLPADLELTIVYDEDPTVGGWPLDGEGIRAWSMDYVNGVADELRARTGRPVETTVLGGRHVAKTLERHVARSAVDLVVMTTHGRGAFGRAWLGSTADHIVRHGPTAVMLIRPEAESTASLDALPLFQRVLVPVDGSELAEQAIPWATRVGRAFNASYTLLRAVPPVLQLQSPYLPHTIEQTRETLEEGRTQAERYLADVAHRFVPRGATVNTELDAPSRPATAVLHYADRHPIDLIVLATHGRGGLARAILGSVADKVVRAARIPVLLVRAARDAAPEGETIHDDNDHLVRHGADG